MIGTLLEALGVALVALGIVTIAGDRSTASCG